MKEITAVVFCPECDYEIDVAQKAYSKYDYTCPACGQKKLSEFETVRFKINRSNKNETKRI